jgi:hypothetical protein
MVTPTTTPAARAQAHRGLSIEERARASSNDIMIEAQPDLVVNDDAHQRFVRRTRRFAPGSLVTNASPRGTDGWRADPFTEDSFGVPAGHPGYTDVARARMRGR